MFRQCMLHERYWGELFGENKQETHVWLLPGTLSFLLERAFKMGQLARSKELGSHVKGLLSLLDYPS